MGRIASLLGALRKRRDRTAGEEGTTPAPPSRSETIAQEPEEKTSAEAQMRFEHEDAARRAAGMPAHDRELAFKCFDEMWEENGKRFVYLPAEVPLYHAGLAHTSESLEDWPMFLSPHPKGCADYAKMVDPTRGEVRSALVCETAKPHRLADFSASRIDFSNPGKTPMGRLAQLTGGGADKTRAHLAQAWCAERRLDGYERASAEELLIVKPRASLRVIETLDMERFGEKYLGSSDRAPGRATGAERE